MTLDALLDRCASDAHTVDLDDPLGPGDDDEVGDSRQFAKGGLGDGGMKWPCRHNQHQRGDDCEPLQTLQLHLSPPLARAPCRRLAAAGPAHPTMYAIMEADTRAWVQ